jgi:hypothetical protein
MSNKMPKNIKALAFDTGGTVFDWHGGPIQTLERLSLPMAALVRTPLPSLE